MIGNYLKIAFRNITRYKFISVINIFGLTIGLTCCLLIFTFILHDLSYDKNQALIALLTISFQAIKAAIKNPVRSLRTE